MNTNTTTPDTGAPNTATDAQVVDTATAVDTGTPATDTPVSEDAAILSAIRGEEAPKEGEDTTAPVEGKADTPATDPAKGADATAGKEGDKGGTPPAKEAKGEDAILDDETPKDYKGRTREQFDKLKERGNHYRQEAQTLQAKLAEMAPAIEREANFTRLLVDSEGTPEDIGTAISLIRAVNKGSLEERRNAFQVINALRGIVADQIGEVLPEVDYLSAFPAIQQRVKDGDLSVDDALKLVRAERLVKASDETAAQLAARQKKEAEAREAETAAVNARQQVGATVEAQARQFLARDGQAVYEIRTGYALRAAKQLQDVAGTIDPAKLPELYVKFYNSEEANTLVAAATAVNRPPVSTGVRPVMGGPRGGGQAVREVQSEDEAILAALRGG